MKIIKATIDLETWFLETTCPTCKSVLGVESQDIRYFWTKHGCYYYTCILCNNRHILNDDKIPAIVAADVIKSRKDPDVSSDW